MGIFILPVWKCRWIFLSRRLHGTIHFPTQMFTNFLSSKKIRAFSSFYIPQSTEAFRKLYETLDYFFPFKNQFGPVQTFGKAKEICVSSEVNIQFNNTYLVKCIRQMYVNPKNEPTPLGSKMNFSSRSNKIEWARFYVFGSLFALTQAASA